MFRKNQKSEQPKLFASLCRRRPIFPGRFHPSIVGTEELNYRVRNGNGWTLSVINTDYGIHRMHLSETERRFMRMNKGLVTRAGIEPTFEA